MNYVLLLLIFVSLRVSGVPGVHRGSERPFRLGPALFDTPAGGR